MNISCDIGSTNFGVFITDADFKPLFLENLCLKPYSAEKFIAQMDQILNTTFEANNSPTISTILIEQQMRTNISALQIAAHVEMYFKIKYPESKVIFCSPKKKCLANTFVESKAAVASVSAKYRERKKRSVEKAVEFFQRKSYEDYVQKINSAKKKDDMTDAVCQLLYHFKLSS